MTQRFQHVRLLAAMFAVGALVATASADDDGLAPLDPHVTTFFQQHCVDCHGAETQEGGVRFDAVESYRSQDSHLWTQVHEKLAAGEMPPKDHPQPDAMDRERLLDWIVAEQRANASGRVRRLNRRELAASLRDATGLSIDYAAALPGDGAVDGFDTGADGLQDTADSTAQAMRVARRAVDGIRFLEPSPAVVYSADLRGVKDAKKAFDAWKSTGASAKGPGIGRQGMGWLIEPKWVGERGDFTFRMPPHADHKGVVRVTLVVSLLKSREEIPNPRLWVEVGGVEIDQPEITAPLDEPQRLVYEVQIDDLPIDAKGLTIALGNKVEVPYAIEGFENDDKSRPDQPVPGGTGLFRPAYDKKAMSFEERPVPFVVLQQVDIEMDYVATWPPAAWGIELGELQDDHETAKRLLSIWIDRAWRRKTTEKERAKFLALYERLRGDGMSFDDALRAAFQSALMSTSFRFLAPPSNGDEAVSQDALAARLSFMLCGGPPDEELRKLAVAGKLAASSVLDSQVDRLLSDSRSDAFTRPFVTQWLEMGQPITIAMDYLQKQDFRFGRYLKASLQEETIGYVARLLTDNRSARELIDSDWTLMNDILARHYGYEDMDGGIQGGQLRRVTLRKDDPRGGGILGHAGIQSMLCWMGENWVIYRGAWTLRRILDDPPPPPPLEVPELIPSDAANRGKPFKELLRQHQQDQRCAVCHRSMDPLGFAFQNFDLSGRWRDVEFERYVKNDLDGKIEWRGEGKTRPVDAVGKLPRGEAFASFAECKTLIVEHYLDDVVRGLMKHWLLYGTGRKPDVADLAEIRTIMEQHRRQGYPMRDMLKALICSPSFLR